MSVIFWSKMGNQTDESAGLPNTNPTLRKAMQGPWPFLLNDCVTAFAGGGQSSAQLLQGGANHITIAASTGASCILPSLVPDNEDAPIMFVINDGANAISIYCARGEALNGATNGSLSIASGGFGIFLRIMPTLDWRAQAFT